MQERINGFNKAFINMAAGYVTHITNKIAGKTTYTPEMPGGPLRWGMTLADEVRVANLLAVTVGKLWDKMAQEPPQDSTEPVKLGPGVSFWLENTSVSAPCNQPDGVPVNVLDRLKNLCEFCKEMSTRGGIWAARFWGIDAVALDLAIAQIEGTQTAQEAAQDAPEAAAGKDAAQGVEADMRDTWEAIADILTGRKAAPEKNL